MHGKRVYYEKYISCPEIANVCLNCTCENCDGICDGYKNAVRKMLGLNPLPHFQEKLGENREKREQPEKRAYEYRRLYEMNGETHTLREWSKISGIGYNTLYMRIYRTGMTIQQAVSKPPRPIRIVGAITANGETHTVAEWADIIGVKPRRIYERIERGYSPEQAVTLKKMGRSL